MRGGGVAVCIAGERGDREQRMRGDGGKRRWSGGSLAVGNDISLRDVKEVKNERKSKKMAKKEGGIERRI